MFSTVSISSCVWLDDTDLGQGHALRRSLSEAPLSHDCEHELDEPDFGSDFLESFEYGLILASVSVLGVMFLESMLLWFAYGTREFWGHWPFVLDVVVISKLALWI